MSRTAYINLGSNLGDRHAVIKRAIDILSERLSVRLTLSAPVVSPPWGFDSPHEFVNVGASFPTDLSPEEILEILLDVEHGISTAGHRDDRGGYVDRIIDIDLIAVDDLVMDMPALQLPHPRMHLRRFVLEPMKEIAPGWIHPLTGMTPAGMLELL